jgi:hypothetical protein
MNCQWFSAALFTVVLTACGGPKTYADSEDFRADSRYHQNFSTEASTLCNAAKRALLSDGYVVTMQDSPNMIGSKSFQVEEKSHAVLQLHISCSPRSEGATLFLTATEEHFDVKTSRKSTLIGVPVVTPISIGSKSETDNQVKTRGETVTDRSFYNRFYQAVQRELSR